MGGWSCVNMIPEEIELAKKKKQRKTHLLLKFSVIFIVACLIPLIGKLCVWHYCKHKYFSWLESLKQLSRDCYPDLKGAATAYACVSLATAGAGKHKVKLNGWHAPVHVN